MTMSQHIKYLKESGENMQVADPTEQYLFRVDIVEQQHSLLQDITDVIQNPKKPDKLIQ